jgi:adenine-specific DNA-methyltransferase
MEEWIDAGRIVFPEDPRAVRFESLEELDAAVAEKRVPLSGGRPIIRPDLPGYADWVSREIGFGTPGFKRYMRDLKNPTQPLSSWIIPRSELETKTDEANEIVAATNDEGTKVIKSLFGEKAFNYPKPPSLIRGLLDQATSPGDVVLDFFAGSATTAQAVMQLNAQDGGDRRFIMVSSTEATLEEPAKNLCDTITAERVRRLNKATGEPFAALNASFAYLRMAKLRFEDLDYDLTAGQVWAALEAMHGLPLTIHDNAASWVEHESDEAVVILVERVDEALSRRLEALARRRTPAFVYAWAPGQVIASVGALDLEIRPVRETLVSRFRT